MGWYGAGWGWMVLGWISMTLFWVLVIVGVVALVRAATRGGQSESALDILRKRYAAGELTKEQFEQMKRDLT